MSQHQGENASENRKREWLRMLKFTLFSASAGIIQVASFALFHDVFHFPSYWMSYLPSLVLSVLWNFTFNRRYTFRSDADITRSMLLVGVYYAVFTPLTSFLGQFLSGIGVHDWLVEGINMLLNFVTEFFYQKLVVYRKTIDTNALAQRGR